MRFSAVWIATSLVLSFPAGVSAQDTELASTPGAEPPSTEPAQAAGVAADLVQQILAGQDDDGSWRALTSALDVEDAAAADHESTPAGADVVPVALADIVPSAREAAGGARTTLSAWIDATRSELVAEPGSAEALTYYVILVLVGIALASIVIGLARRTLGARRARVGSARARPGGARARRVPPPRKAVRRGRARRRRRGSGDFLCRDAERLAAHVRVHRAA